MKREERTDAQDATAYRRGTKAVPVSTKVPTRPA
jgi:hypothetical protein